MDIIISMAFVPSHEVAPLRTDVGRKAEESVMPFTEAVSGEHDIGGYLHTTQAHSMDQTLSPCEAMFLIQCIKNNVLLSMSSSHLILCLFCTRNSICKITWFLGVLFFFRPRYRFSNLGRFCGVRFRLSHSPQQNLSILVESNQKSARRKTNATEHN
jgi:hypothetical protein